MTIPLPTIKKLIQEALANHEKKPDYAAFCLSEAQEQLTALKNEIDEEHEKRWFAILGQCDMAQQLNSPDSGKLLEERRAIIQERFSERDSFVPEWEKMAKAWHELFKDDQRTMECLHNTLYLLPNAGSYNQGRCISYAQRVRDMFGNGKTGYLLSFLKNLEKDYYGNAFDLIILAGNGFRMLGDVYYNDATRCLRKAESLSKNSDDWTDCARLSFILAGDKWDENTQRYMSTAEKLAVEITDWKYCCELYLLDTGKRKDAERCLQKMQESVQDAKDHNLYATTKQKLNKIIAKWTAEAHH